MGDYSTLWMRVRTSDVERVKEIFYGYSPDDEDTDLRGISTLGYYDVRSGGETELLALLRARVPYICMDDGCAGCWNPMEIISDGEVQDTCLMSGELLVVEIDHVDGTVRYPEALAKYIELRARVGAMLEAAEPPAVDEEPLVPETRPLELFGGLDVAGAAALDKKWREALDRALYGLPPEKEPVAAPLRAVKDTPAPKKEASNALLDAVLGRLASMVRKPDTLRWGAKETPQGMSYTVYCEGRVAGEEVPLLWVNPLSTVTSGEQDYEICLLPHTTAAQYIHRLSGESEAAYWDYALVQLGFREHPALELPKATPKEEELLLDVQMPVKDATQRAAAEGLLMDLQGMIQRDPFRMASEEMRHTDFTHAQLGLWATRVKDRASMLANAVRLSRERVGYTAVEITRSMGKAARSTKED